MSIIIKQISKKTEKVKKNIDKKYINAIIKNSSRNQYAGMAELADALDLGSSVFDVGVQVLFPAPVKPVVIPLVFLVFNYSDLKL